MIKRTTTTKNIWINSDSAETLTAKYGLFAECKQLVAWTARTLQLPAADPLKRQRLRVNSNTQPQTCQQTNTAQRQRGQPHPKTRRARGVRLRNKEEWVTVNGPFPPQSRLEGSRGERRCFEERSVV